MFVLEGKGYDSHGRVYVEGVCSVLRGGHFSMDKLHVRKWVKGKATQYCGERHGSLNLVTAGEV